MPMTDERFNDQFIAPLLGLEVSPEQASRLIGVLKARVRSRTGAPAYAKGVCSGCWNSDCQCQSYASPDMQAAYPRSDSVSGLLGKHPESFTENRRRRAEEADAERLAELKKVKAATTADGCGPCRDLDALIAVYEECAARGLTFGGGR